MEKNMETAAFWIDRMGPAKRDELLAPESRIRRLNRRALEIPACEVNDVFGEADPEGGCAAARPERRGFARGAALGAAPVTFLPEKPEEGNDEGYLTELEEGEPFLALQASEDGKYLKIRTTCVEGWVPAEGVRLFGPSGKAGKSEAAGPVKPAGETEITAWQAACRPWYPRMLCPVPGPGPEALTPSNLLKELFRNYGAAYRFGSRTDCTGYIRTVYERFGFLLPSNSVKQRFFPSVKHDLEGLPDGEKRRILRGLPTGTLLYMPMHAMVLLGEAGGRLFIINAVSSYCDGEGRLHCPRRIMVNPLELRRKDGETWLSSLTAALVPWEEP